MTTHQDALRASVAALALKARWVRCEEDRLDDYLAQVARRDEQQTHDPTLTEVGDTETRIAFVLLRDATNFGSGWHPQLTKLQGLSGARTTGTLLARHVAEQGAPSAIDGVLTFDPDLEDRIEAGETVPAGSAEEIEIPAMAVYATERSAALATERGDPVMPLRLSD